MWDQDRLIKFNFNGQNVCMSLVPELIKVKVSLDQVEVLQAQHRKWRHKKENGVVVDVIIHHREAMSTTDPLSHLCIHA